MWRTVSTKPNESNEDIIRRLYQYMDIVDTAEVDGVVYAVMQGLRTGYKKKSAFIFLIMRNSPTEAQVQDMLENYGPFQDLCPVHLLDQLDPTSIAEANSWRNRCRANNIQLDKPAAPTKLVDGLRIRFIEPIEFENDMVLDTFTVKKVGKATRFLLDDSDDVFEIPGFRAMEWEAV